MKKVILALMIVFLAASIALAGSETKKPFRIAAIFQTAIEEPWDGVPRGAVDPYVEAWREYRACLDEKVSGW